MHVHDECITLRNVEITVTHTHVAYQFDWNFEWKLIVVDIKKLILIVWLQCLASA